MRDVRVLLRALSSIIPPGDSGNSTTKVYIPWEDRVILPGPKV